MNVYYRNLNPNCDRDVTGSMNELLVIRENLPNYRCIVDFGMVQNQTMSTEQLYKINARNLSLGGGCPKDVKQIPINDILVSHG